MTPPVRIVIVGCGDMARQWARVCVQSSLIEVVGLTDLQRDRAQALADEAGLPQHLVFDSLDQALQQARPEAVFDVAVPQAHYDITMAALGAGCHVLGEKPLADTIERARLMVQAAENASLIFAVTQTRRAVSAAQSVAQTLRDGVVGTVHEVHCDFFCGPHFGGFREVMESPLLLDMAIHSFDHGRLFADADPVRVYCCTSNPGHSWFVGDASATAIFEMRASDGRKVVFTYRGSWCAHGQGTSWNGCWRCLGTRGEVTWDGEDDIAAKRVPENHEPAFIVDLEPAQATQISLAYEGHEQMILEFARAVDAHRRGETAPVMCPASDNIKSLAMVLSAVQSAKENRSVEVVW